MNDTYEVSLDPGSVILVVDDDPLCCNMIRHMLEPDDVLMIEADSMASARNLLENNTAVRIDVILLDRSLPDGDGLDLLSFLADLPHLKNVPVIVQSGLVSPEDYEDGLRRGAFHYLSKPYRRNMLRSLVRVAVKEGRERKYLLDQIQRSERGLEFLTSCEFEVRSLGDIRVLVPYLAQFFPNPETAAIGASELMVNAVEHGNLGIGYETKGRLLERNEWGNEIDRRLAMPAYWRRRVRVRLSRNDERVELLITDDGEGFDWREFDQVDDERLYHLHGRGIAMARHYCFDGLEFIGKGNQVRCWTLL